MFIKKDVVLYLLELEGCYSAQQIWVLVPLFVNQSHPARWSNTDLQGKSEYSKLGLSIMVISGNALEQIVSEQDCVDEHQWN